MDTSGAIDILSIYLRLFAVLALLPLSAGTAAADGTYNYDAIAKRYSESQLDASRVEDAKMQGEGLVGLKELNFQKREDFDPVAEWTSFRSLSLLEQFPPYTVLIIMEVARDGLLELEAEE